MDESNQTERLWGEMHDRLLSYITSRVNHIHDAEDILQDVFTRIHKKVDTLKDSQSITAWMFQIARNAIVDYYRDRASAAKTMIRLMEDAPEDGDDTDENDMTVRAEQDFSLCLTPLLSELPPKYRQALELTDLGGATQKEAAEKLGLSVSGMKTRVQRGREKFKEILQECCHIEFDRRGGVVDYHRRDQCGKGNCSDGL